MTDLFSAVGTPLLPGAVCVGRHDLFDEPEHGTADTTTQTALQLCKECPALAGCRAWFDSLPVAPPAGRRRRRTPPPQP